MIATDQPFIAEIVKEAMIAGQPSHCELGFVLIFAATLGDAEARAGQIGRRGPRTYTNNQGQSVEWRFVRVQSVSPAVEERLVDGAELHAQVYRNRGAYEIAAAQRTLD